MLKNYDDSGIEINVYYRDDGWKFLQQAVPDVKLLLLFLNEHRCDAHWQEANSLTKAPAIWGVFERRGPQCSYNNWPYYVAADSVRALEQVVEVKIGLGERWTWREDGEMHHLASVLYHIMQEEGFPQNSESYQTFFIRMVEAGRLQVNASS